MTILLLQGTATTKTTIAKTTKTTTKINYFATVTIAALAYCPIITSITAAS